MTVTQAYWKRKEDSHESFYTAGCCPVEDVPSYGEVKSLAIPKTVETVFEDNGAMIITSPPILGTKTAYRYRLYLSAQAVRDIPLLDGFTITRLLNVQSVSAPHRGANLDNWYWYAQDDFRSAWPGTKTPVRLAKAWKRGVLEALLATHPNKDAYLQQWDLDLAGHKAYTASQRKTRAPIYPKQDGDLVVSPRPRSFKNGKIHQIFRYHTGATHGYGRAKNTLHVEASRYTIPHGNMATFHNGRAPFEGISPPVRAAMAMLAWASAPLHTSHDIVRTAHTFDAHVEATLADLHAWIQDASANPVERRTVLHAARNALRCFFPNRPKDLGAAGEAIFARIHAQAASLQDILSLAYREACASTTPTHEHHEV